METAQKRSVPFGGRLLVVTLAGAALIAALGLLTAIDTIELPVIGGNESTSSTMRDNAPTWNSPADRMPGASSFSSTDDTGSALVTTNAGHRHQIYLDEGVEFTGALARPAGGRTNPAEHSNHRYFAPESAPQSDSESYPETHRIGQATD